MRSASLPTLSLSAALLAALLLGPGCRRKEEPEPPAATVAPAPPPPPKAAASAPAPAASDAVASYPDEVPMGTVTVEVLQEFTVHQAADLTSTVIAHVGHGEFINIKSTHSNWMKIEYPSAVGVVSPGWIDLRNVYDPRVRVHHGPLPARLPPNFHKPRQ